MERETEGILQVGEVPVVIRRDSAVEADHSQAVRSGRQSAFEDALRYVDLAQSSAPPFTDLRPYADLRTFLLDKIRETANGTPED